MEHSIFDIVSLAVSAASAIATAILAIIVFRWTRKSERSEVTRSVQADWRDYNLAVLSDKDLQDLEAENHLVGGLSNTEVKKMCIYFIKLNVPYNMWIASNSDLIDDTRVDAEIENQATLLRKDQDFIERNVFPRGYDEAFCDLVRTKWRELARDGTKSSATEDKSTD